MSKRGGDLGEIACRDWYIQAKGRACQGQGVAPGLAFALQMMS